MQAVRAFVGHSFGEADKEVVRAFTDHFDNLEKANSNFTWDHAEDAEPTTLSEKVLSKIQDKNVFIGICTKHERVAKAECFSRCFLQKENVKARGTDLQWKTSDWIIQEIGLAVGREMRVILFLEEGVRDPGGLFGNTEYIPFSREQPHRSFDKLLQMLAALTPTEGGNLSAQTKPAEEPAEEEAGDRTDDWDPKLDWPKKKYNQTLIWLSFDNDEPKLAKLDAAFKASVHAQGDGAVVWDAQREYWRLRVGKSGDLEKLKSLARENPKAAQIGMYVGLAYERFNEFDKAGMAYEDAAAGVQHDTKRVVNLGRAAVAYAKGSSKKRAVELVEVIRTMVAGNSALEEEALNAVHDWSDTAKDEISLLSTMEGRVAHRPDDNKRRFSLAYKHSEVENTDMSLYHYSRIPTPQRDPTTWNNLGVAYGAFGMPVKEVDAYRVSAQENETLAMSNLGYKFLGAGFLREAQQECDRALAVKEYHKNIPGLLGRCRDVVDEEEKKLDETMGKVRQKADFYRALGVAIVRPSAKTLASKWQAPETILDLTMDEGAVRFIGTFQKTETGALGLGLGALLGGGDGKPRTVVHKTDFALQIRGHVLSGTVSRTRDGYTASLLEMAGGPKVVMWLEENGSVMHVMENYPSVTPSFYRLTAIN